MYPTPVGLNEVIVVSHELLMLESHTEVQGCDGAFRVHPVWPYSQNTFGSALSEQQSPSEVLHRVLFFIGCRAQTVAAAHV